MFRTKESRNSLFDALIRTGEQRNNFFASLIRTSESKNIFFVSFFESWIKNQLIFCFFANPWPKISSKFRFEMSWTLPKLASIIQSKPSFKNYLIDLKFCCFRELVTNYWLCNSDMLRLELFLASNKALRNHRFRLIVILLVFARLCISLTLELYASSKTCYFIREVAFCG